MNTEEKLKYSEQFILSNILLQEGGYDSSTQEFYDLYSNDNDPEAYARGDVAVVNGAEPDTSIKLCSWRKGYIKAYTDRHIINLQDNSPQVCYDTYYPGGLDGSYDGLIQACIDAGAVPKSTEPTISLPDHDFKSADGLNPEFRQLLKDNGYTWGNSGDSLTENLITTQYIYVNTVEKKVWNSGSKEVHTDRCLFEFTMSTSNPTVEPNKHDDQLGSLTSVVAKSYDVSDIHTKNLQIIGFDTAEGVLMNPDLSTFGSPGIGKSTWKTGDPVINNHINPQTNLTKKESQMNPTTINTTNLSFSQYPVYVINGQEFRNPSVDQLMNEIASREAQIKKIRKLKAKTKTSKKQITKIQSQIDKLVKVMDNLED